MSRCWSAAPAGNAMAGRATTRWICRWRFTRLQRPRRKVVSADATIPEPEKISTADSQTKKRLRLGASRKPEPPKSRTLKRNLIQTVRCTACQATSPVSGQCYTAVTPPPFRRSKCDGRHNALPRCNASARAMFGRSQRRWWRGDRNTRQWTTLVLQAFFANARRFSAAEVVQEQSCRTVDLFTRSLPK